MYTPRTRAQIREELERTHLEPRKEGLRFVLDYTHGDIDCEEVATNLELVANAILWAIGRRLSAI